MIGESIKRIRKEAGMTQIEFCNAIRCEQGFISKLENGHVHPSYAMAIRFLKFAKTHKIKVSIEDLFILE
jgi:transcriptional regulator with XRE-family HTH domain